MLTINKPFRKAELNNCCQLVLVLAALCERGRLSNETYQDMRVYFCSCTVTVTVAKVHAATRDVTCRLSKSSRDQHCFDLRFVYCIRVVNTNKPSRPLTSLVSHYSTSQIMNFIHFHHTNSADRLSLNPSFWNDCFTVNGCQSMYICIGQRHCLHLHRDSFKCRRVASVCYHCDQNRRNKYGIVSIT